MSGRPGQAAAIETLQASVYQIPTDAPEADGTLAWSTTTLVVAEARGGGRRGTGYTCAAGACQPLISPALASDWNSSRPTPELPGELR